MVSTLTIQGASSEGKRLSDAVYETMLDGIISGKLKPGTIVSEVAIARQLQVSRTPVHDALRQLAKDGLVQQRANHRAVIAEFTAADIYDLYQMRKLRNTAAPDRPLAVPASDFPAFVAVADRFRRNRGYW